MRAKWSAPIRKYWKISEQMMVRYCDLAICDSVNTRQQADKSIICRKEVITKEQFIDLIQDATVQILF